MKKIIYSFTAFLLLIFMISFNGCDELQSLPLNIPFKVLFSSTTSSNSSFDDATFCLSGSDDWNDNVDKIRSAKYISSALWITQGTTAGLTGTVAVTVRQGNANGPVIFALTFPNVTVANYTTNPLFLSLNATQIQAMNTYLDSFKNNDLCFYATLVISNINGQGPPFTVNGRIEMVIEAEVEF